MTPADATSNTPAPHARVLTLSATARDGTLARQVLARVDIDTCACANVAEAVREMERGAGALLLAEEALLAPDAPALERALATQPPWSDLPVLLLSRPGAASHQVDHAMQALANVTVIERPVRIASLVSMVRAALRARARQLDLRELLRGLQQTEQRRTEFLATLAHELRNPMAPLTTTLALLQRQQPAPAEAQPHYARMSRQLEHMGRLIDDLTEMTRVTRGKITLRPERLALDRVILDAVELSRPLLAAGGHSLDLNGLQPGLVVQGDGVRLAQVFANLLNNAAKYTPPGGHIVVRACAEGMQARVIVRDDGSGIPSEMLGSIFEMFVQVSDTARAAQGGLGIGLTLARSLVALHGGEIVARSPGTGRGSEFEVRLPLLPGAVLPAGRSPAPARPLAAVGRVLVVDDNRDAADSLAALLGSLGAEVAVAYHGMQALAVAAGFRPVAAILDIGMPGMDGHALAARLRADLGLAAPVLVALTGWRAADEPPRAGAAGPGASTFDHHLLKPPDIDRLVALLAALPGRTAAAVT